jgi:hypothetical protein
MKKFFEELRIQRWDDHRYYHHSRINQALHLLSAISFVMAYFILFLDPAMAAIVAWLVSMTSRQAGHFFFEPTGFDEVNQASHEYKEEIKVGYNLRRKVVLMMLWLFAPLLLWIDSSVFGLLHRAQDVQGYVHNTGMLWLWLGIAGLVFRTVHLFFLKSPMSGLVWMSKILTDPFHDIKLYYKAPLYLMRGELIEPRARQFSRQGVLSALGD